MPELGEGRRVERPGRDSGQAEASEPLRHLARGLVRERHDEDAPRVDGAGRDRVGDPVGDDAGLAGPGAGVDHQRPAGDPDGLDLLRVEVDEQRLGIDGGSHRRPSTQPRAVIPRAVTPPPAGGASAGPGSG